MHLLNNTLKQDLRLHTRIVTNTLLFLALIQTNIDVEIEKTLRASARLLKLLRSQKQSHISIKPINTQPRWEAWYRQNSIWFEFKDSNPWSPAITVLTTYKSEKHDLMRPIKINIQCDKTSNMLFLNDLNSSEVF